MDPENPGPESLVSCRLTLRRPSAEDAADALLMLTDPLTALFHAAPGVTDLAAATDWCVRGAAWDGTFATWHAVDATGRFVANATLFDIDLEHATAGIGYRVGPWARGQGVATEVVDTVARWGFVGLGLARIRLEHVTRNPASCRVAVKAGFPLEGLLRSAYLDPEGLRQDCHLHGRLSGDPVPAAESPQKP